MSTKLYSCPICRKGVKSISGLTRHLNACKGHLYPKPHPPHEPLRHESHNEEDALGGNWEDKGGLLGEMVTSATANGTPETLTEDTPWKRLFANESSLALREEWFNSHEFPAGTPISDKKYKYLGYKHKNSFYSFNDQLDYGLAHYFAESETTKGNVNKFLTDLLMVLLTKKLSYKNADEWMEKLSEIPWGIPNDESIEHRFDVENGVSGIARQEIAIQSRNVINCVEFLIGHPGFQYNQIYEPSHIYNQNKHRVYNEMHTGNWWLKQQMEHPPRARIILILLSSDKTVISPSHGDQTLWPVYITIGNLDTKTRRSQTRPGTLLLGSIPVVYERLEDGDNKNKDLKAKIYHLALKTMLQRKCPSSMCK